MYSSGCLDEAFFAWITVEELDSTSIGSKNKIFVVMAINNKASVG